MNETLFTELGQRISWTLVHSVWQFSLVAVVLAGALRLVRGRSPHLRYSLMLVAMIAMVIAPCVTFPLVTPENRAVQSQVAGVGATLEHTEVDLSGSEPRFPPNLESGFPSSVVSAEENEESKRSGAEGAEKESMSADLYALTVSALDNFVQSWMNVILAGWLAGMLLLSVRPLIGWKAARALRSNGRTTVSASIASATARVAARLGVRRVIEVAQSTLVEVPTVIGWLKPLVLLPASAISGLSGEQLEAVIAHELAHVRRHDYLVNLFQLAMETVFFYHPAVWWVSHRMRVEREDCCDEIAANLTGDRVGYAKLLVWLEESRQQPNRQTLVMSADGGSLRSRVLRLVSTQAESKGIGPLAIATVLTAVVVTGSMLAISAGDSVAEGTDSSVDDQLAVKVTDDVSVKLVAVLPHLGSAEQAWRPGGEPFADLPSLPESTADSQDQPVSRIDYVFQFAGLADGQHPTYKTDGLKTWRHPGDDGLTRIETRPSSQSTSVTVEVGIPDKEWGPWVSVNAAGEIVAPVVVPPRLQNSHNVMRFHDAQPRGDRTMLRWADDRNGRDLATFEVVAVDNDAKRHQRWGRTLWDDENGVTRTAEVFDLSSDQIDHFEYRLRPYRHWVTFENVSLKLGEKTNFKTSVETIVIPSADKEVSFAGRIVRPDGTPAKSKGWMYYTATHEEENSLRAYLGTIGEFTDAFRFKSRPGESFISYHPSGFAPTWTPKMKVGPGDLVEGIVLQLQYGEHVTIQIQDADSNPVNGATLIAHPEIHGSVEGPIFPTKVPDGIIKLEHLANTEYRFGVEAAGFKSLMSGPLPIPQDRRLVLTMQRTRSDDHSSSLAPPADPDAQKLGEAVHRQLTEVDRLKSVFISTRSFTSYYGDPKGVLGLKSERSLEHLRAALEKRDFDRSLSTADQLFAWDENNVLATKRNKYVYEENPYDQKSSRTWDGKHGWYHDSTNSFGRYRTFAETFKHHYFRPSKFLYLGDHKFSWAARNDYPNFFVSSQMPVEYANYQSLPDEDFDGESCSVVQSIPRAERFWISKTSGHLIGCLTFINQGRFKQMHDMESIQQIAGRTFDTKEEYQRWLTESATEQQRYEIGCEYYYAHRHNQRPNELIEFSNFREVAPGVQLPMTEWRSDSMHEGERFKYSVSQTIVRDFKTDADVDSLVAELLPKTGDKINDWRFSTHVTYPFDPDMPESDIHELVDKAQSERLENQRAIDVVLKPLKEMVGKPAPKLTGETMAQSELPEITQGKPTLLHFWATWCGPCKNDIPLLNKMLENDWNIIGVHAPGTDAKEIETAMNDSGIEYPVLLGSEIKGSGFDPDRITGYPVQMFPCCVLINKDGNVEAVGTLQEILAR